MNVKLVQMAVKNAQVLINMIAPYVQKIMYIIMSQVPSNFVVQVNVKKIIKQKEELIVILAGLNKLILQKHLAVIAQ